MVQEFHLTLDEYGDLTERQIVETYYHPRDDKSGAIKRSAPERVPLTCEQQVAQYLQIAAMMNQRKPGAFPDAVVAAKVAEIRASYAKTTGDKA
jgi:hypothetical protein